MSLCMHPKSLQSCPTLCNLWTVTCQSPLSMGFSRQEYWSELPRPPPGDLPDSGIEPTSLTSPALAGRFFTTVPPGKPFLTLDQESTSFFCKKFFHFSETWCLETTS